MRFKATISTEGLIALERRYLPTLEKFGKRCAVLLSPSEVYLVQDTTEADGMQISGSLSAAAVFVVRPNGEAAPDVCVSRLNNFIGFDVEVALLLKVLRSAISHTAEALDVRLTTRTVPGPPTAPGANGAQRPMLMFSWRGDNVTLGQELPISKPYQELAINDLRQLCNLPALCPFYLDILREVPQLMGVMDKLRSLLGASGTLTLVLTRSGDVHLTVEGAGVKLGEGLRGLECLPQSVAADAHPLQATSAEARLREAQQCGDAVSATLQVKHLSKALHSAPLTKPSRLLCGVAGSGSFLHLMFVYQSDQSQAYDDNYALSYKLPLQESEVDFGD